MNTVLKPKYPCLLTISNNLIVTSSKWLYPWLVQFVKKKNFGDHQPSQIFESATLEIVVGSTQT